MEFDYLILPSKVFYEEESQLDQEDDRPSKKNKKVSFALHVDPDQQTRLASHVCKLDESANHRKPLLNSDGTSILTKLDFQGRILLSC